MDKIILAIDDSDTNLALTNNALCDFYTVYTVSSGKKALQMLKKIKPHLILLDIDMPEMDGFEVMEKLKSHDILKEIPVVFLSAMKDNSTIARSFGLGAVDFIRKPFSPEGLLEKVNYHVELNLFERWTAEG